MTEKEYIVVSDKRRVEIAEGLIRNMLPEESGIDPIQHSHVVEIMHNWLQRLHTKVKIQPEGE